MTALRVSVIVPCFNQGATLAEAVDSALGQTMDDLEVLVVDDGSDDEETLAVLERFSRPRTTLYRTPNRGLAAARNLLVGHARGEYLCALDADDRLRPTLLERACAVLDAEPDVSFVSAWLEAFGEESWQWRQHRCDLPALLAEDTVMTAAVVRRSAVVEVGGYDEGMPHPGDEDWDLWIRLVRAGHRGVILPEVLFDYRRRPGSMGERCVEGQVHLDLVCYLVEKHADAFQEHLLDVLALKEHRIGELLEDNDRLERRLGSHLEPVLELRRAELERLRRRLAGDAASGDRELDRLRAEVRALRQSWSWRLTAPLRAVAGALGYRGRRGGGGS